MPVYEYTCTKCENRFEAFVHTAKAKVECPQCGSGKVSKLLSLFGTRSNGPAADAGGSGHSL